jgi:hypothetical protein
MIRMLEAGMGSTATVTANIDAEATAETNGIS